MNPPELPKEFLQDYQCIPTDGPSQMDLAKEWVAGLVAEKILTEHQGQSLLSSHVAVTGSDGKSYGLSFDPTKPTPEDITQSIVARRLHLRVHTPLCPACGCTDQIQLKDWFITPAEWKCRICKHKWSHEPTPP